MTTDRQLATRHACSLSRDPGAGLRHTEGGGKGPASGRCRYCRGRIVVQRGLWGVFVWRGDGDYPHERAGATRLSEGAAERAAAALNNDLAAIEQAGHSGWVVRWIPEEALQADELDAACETYWANRPAGRKTDDIPTREKT